MKVEAVMAELHADRVDRVAKLNEFINGSGRIAQMFKQTTVAFEQSRPSVRAFTKHLHETGPVRDLKRNESMAQTVWRSHVCTPA